MVDVILIGTSSMARETLNLVRSAGSHQPIGFLDDSPERWGTLVGGLPVLGALEALDEHPDADLLVCVSSGTTRARIVARLGMLGIDDERFARMIHPSVEVPRNCRVGAGSVLFAGVAMTADVTIGRHVVVMPNVNLSHGNRIQSFATLGAGSSFGAGVRVAEEATVGMNSSVRDRSRIGRRATLALGSTLLRDLPAGEIWFGVPARPAPAPTAASKPAGALPHARPHAREGGPRANPSHENTDRLEHHHA